MSSRRSTSVSARSTNDSGAHFLINSAIARQLVRSCAVGCSDTVVELGAGAGAITTHLAATGARVLAVERDPELLRRLRRRFGCERRVSVIGTDIGRYRLPRTPFVVVASIPYGISSMTCRLLFGSAPTALRCASLLVEWGFAKRLTEPVPRSAELAWWNARFTIELRRRIPPRSFSPSPAVWSAQLVARRNTEITGNRARALRVLLLTAYSAPAEPARAVVRAAAPGLTPHRVLRAAGVDPSSPARRLTPQQWSSVARALANDSRLHWPPLPRELGRRWR
ncbi:methyltransferase domain-containing protein [Haloechinothrix sp. YIM 98757]|uniref:Methyltransferase domain-containing protein n=1 Tax=Haloechinothrix aidingensis TaxID=2752311 RepID=A0A838A967_9PSEU|nr:rRNA adenine N-6-methyltransferase family protein [Haloechinothrix aidingensis]MBA0125092.1 methyltransferase domain-containing protein [Haloechinothrix aidingensis]